MIGLALRGYHIIVTLTWGIIAGIALGLAFGLLTGQEILTIDSETNRVGRALVSGITGHGLLIGYQRTGNPDEA